MGVADGPKVVEIGVRKDPLPPRKDGHMPVAQ